MSELGDRLRAERDRHGGSQTAFGALGGVSRNTQMHYETGERTPDAAYLASLIPHGVDVWFVLTGQPFPPEAETVTGPAARLLTIFNALSPEAQVALLGIAEALAAPNR